ncbi:hypothetical protein AVEN_270087-1 [Araneus ventricosus]|uniref:Transposase Tc1-like domain-containing protein n=1 Tax=Araneus ventricosus TaxID=182803 RepID=A0A4Y2LGK0_ARAVE|nr:hypothetical protein AVEN_270087-1 [Araneus ventricosus]
MDFMYYANEDETPYLFTRDYYYKKDVPAGLYVKTKDYGKIWETGCVTSRPRVRRPRNVGRKLQPEDVLSYALVHSQSSKKMISENCGLKKSRVWTILNEAGAHPYRSIPVQRLLPRHAERRYTWCHFVMNNLVDHPKFLADIIWTDEACFSHNGMFNRRNVHTSLPENPRYSVEIPHQLRWSINVWCGIFNDRLNGLVFYEGKLTGQRYLELLHDVITATLLRLYRCNNLYASNMTAPLRIKFQTLSST